MRKVIGLLLMIVVLLGLAGHASSVLQAGQSINGSLTAAQGEKRLLSEAELIQRIRQLEPAFRGPLNRGAVDCEIWDANGDVVTTVFASQLGDAAYWLQYLSNGTASQKVTFLVVPRFEGSPLAGQAQVFTPNESSEFDNISTPFGIPFWGLDLTSGPWLFVVRSDSGQQAACPFTVEP